ncbi:nucleotide sugar dehydrogenase [Paenibacillus thalictri]|uniref:nucleotide sugar dehydrogenase n=1 Tax=Paenibacillus thalictri TaxID=2527873 RepID=UPI002682B1E6
MEQEHSDTSEFPTVAVVGLGYVGLPLSLLFARKGFQVIGIDLDRSKIETLRKGRSYIPDIPDDAVQSVLNSARFTQTDNYDAIDHADTIILCVPTPLSAAHTPDLQFLKLAGEEIGRRVKPGQIIVLESSTYPGTTTEILMPLLEQTGLSVGNDIFLGFSPERVDPGNKQYSIEQITKIVSGVTSACKNKIYEVYSRAFDKVITVSSTEAAEMTKLLENCYRFVNISLINEMAMICDRLDIDVWEIIEAAATKPFGFSAFYPGPGVGGHCIPVDPIYLQWKMKQYGMDAMFIELSNNINQMMPSYIVQQIQSALAPDKPMKDANILVYGAAYKKDINDARETSASEIIYLFKKLGAHVVYHDPYVPSLLVKEERMIGVELSEAALQRADCVLILTDHSCIPMQQIMDHARLIYDTRNVTKGMKGKAKVIRLGGK